jgi:hypothetical protein
VRIDPEEKRSLGSMTFGDRQLAVAACASAPAVHQLTNQQLSDMTLATLGGNSPQSKRCCSRRTTRKPEALVKRILPDMQTTISSFFKEPGLRLP